MLHKTTLEQFLQLSEQSARVVVSQEIYGDLLTSVGTFHALAKNKKNAALLDSSDFSHSADACVYIGIDPIAQFSSVKDQAFITVNDKTKVEQGQPFELLRQFYNRYKCSSDHPMAKFAGGMIGYMSYDAVRLVEKLPDRHPNENNIPDMSFNFYATNLVFDKRSGKVLISKVVEVNDNPTRCYDVAMKQIETIINRIINANTKMSMVTSAIEEVAVDTDIDDQNYIDIVNRAKRYVKEGDAFQIVLSRRFRRKYTGDDFNIYRALRVLNPSPYQFYIRNDNFTIVGSSPERLVSLQQGYVETMPIAGTRPRGKSLSEDKNNEQALLNDEKELAEHMMLVDLGRNDIGSVCEPGSVSLDEFKQVKRYSRVMHIVSRVRGKLREGFDTFDVMRAVFPAGTLSGAPKIRAMEIIDEIETSRRGVYGGSVCAIDNEGQMDSCITIRTALIKDGTATIRAGGGVVLDSDPQAEADETRHKAQAVLDALALAEGGFV